MAKHTHNFILVLELLICIGISHGQNEVCEFYGLHADCRYRVDAICLSHISATIDQCTDPIEVKFTVTCERPKVRFSETFSSSRTMVAVHGFDMDVKLEVKLNTKPDDVINVEADFHVSGKARTDFINSDIKLRGLEDKCPLLNKAAKIAIGVVGGILTIAAILIIVLCYIKHQRNAKNRSANRTNHLVENAEDPGQSTPRNSRIYESEADNDHVTSINRYNDTGTDTNINGNLNSNQNDDKTETSGGVRYSDILKQNGGAELKRSDC